MNKSVSFSCKYNDVSRDIIFCSTLNAVLTKSHDSSACDFITLIDGFHEFDWGLYGRVVENNGMLYCIPERANKIMVLDINTMEKHFVVVCPEKRTSRFVDSVIYNNRIWIIDSDNNSPIVVFDMIDETVGYKKFIYDSIPKDLATRKRLFCDCAYQENSMLYLAVDSSDYVVAIDLRREKADYHHVSENQLCLWSTVKKDNLLYLLSRSRADIFTYNLDNHKLQKLVHAEDKMTEPLEGRLIPYSNMFVCDDKVFLIPNYGPGEIWQVDESSVKKVLELPSNMFDHTDMRKNWKRFLRIEKTTKNKWTFYPGKSNVEISFFPNEMVVLYDEVVFSNKFINEVFIKRYVEPQFNREKGKSVYEGSRIDLKSFIEFLVFEDNNEVS